MPRRSARPDGRSPDGLAALPEADARVRLVLAASELFQQKGYAAVSIRAIAERAAANSALIAYYFGDKQGLFLEVLRQAAEPINTRRCARFDALVQAGDFTLRDLVAAWIEPMFEGAREGANVPVASLSLGLSGEYGQLGEQLVVEVYDELNEQFLDLLEACLPDVPRPTLVWRLYFLVGAALTAGRPRAASVKRLSRGAMDGRDQGEMVAQLVSFAVAGFQALAPTKAVKRAVKPRPAQREARRSA